MRRPITAACITAGLLALGGPAVAQGAEKYPLHGPEANVYCAGLHDPVPGEHLSGGPVGFAVFNLTAAGAVSTVVSLKNGLPNTDYPVRLVQDVADCYDVDGVLRTNGQGNGTLRVSEPRAGTAAQVIVDTRSMFGWPAHRATRPFVY